MDTPYTSSDDSGETFITDPDKDWEEQKELIEKLGKETAEEAAFRKSVAEDPEGDLSNVAVDTVSAIEIARNDPDFLSGLSMGDTWEFGWPPVFLTIFAWVTARMLLVRDFSRLAIGLPRGFGKTTFIKVLILWGILFSKKSFFLVLSKTADHAKNIIADVMDMLKDPNIIAMFGDYRINLEIDRSDLKKFHFRGREIIIGGLGAGGNVRGFNLKNRRPDFMLFDDVQSREDADSAIISRGLWRWMIGTAMKAKSPKGCTFVFTANMYPTEHSLLKKIKSNRTWEKFIAGGILQDPVTGELSSLWEDLQPLDQLLQEYAENLADGEPEIFQAEVMNDEHASVNTAIDTSKIKRFTYDEADLHTGNFVIIDPAANKENSDDVSIGYFQIHDYIPVGWDVKYGKMSPMDTIRTAIQMCQKFDCAVIFVEGGAYQSTLKYWFERMFTMWNITGITVVEILPGRTSKNHRIMNMFKQLMGGELMLHPRVYGDYLAQIVAFDPLRSNNKDGLLDLLTYATIILGKHAEYISSKGIVASQMIEHDLDAIDPEEINCAF